MAERSEAKSAKLCIWSTFWSLSLIESLLNKMSSPGGWSQVIVEELKLESSPFQANGRNEDKRFSGDGLLDEIYSMSLTAENCSEQEINKNESGGSCVSCDLRPFRQVNGARQVIGDIFEKETLDQIVAQNEQRDFDLVVSGKRHENIFVTFCNVREFCEVTRLFCQMNELMTIYQMTVI